MREEGGDGRGEEHLAVTHADDERRLTPRADDDAGLVGRDDAEGEVPFEPRDRRPHCCGETLAGVLLDQVHDDLGVGL